MHPRKGMSIEMSGRFTSTKTEMHHRKRMNIEPVNKKHEKGGILPSFLLHIKQSKTIAIHIAKITIIDYIIYKCNGKSLLQTTE